MTPLPLTPAQQVAFDQLLPVLTREPGQAQMAVLEGFAGTGKTFLVARLLAEIANDVYVAVAAPTNKAVRVLKDMLSAAGVPVLSAGEDEDADRWAAPKAPKPQRGCTVRSIHSFLGLHVTELDNGQHRVVPKRAAEIREYAVLVVDEASMLGEELFARIVQEREACCVLFVGDPAQLPPVNGQGALSPVFDRIQHKVRLSEVVRQAKDNPIIQLSIQLRALIEADIKANPLTLAHALPPMARGVSAALWAGSVSDVVRLWLSEHEANPDQDTRIVAYTNARVQDYNRRIHRALYGETGEAVWVPGQRVIVQTQGIGYREFEGFENGLLGEMRLITSEELVVLECVTAPHPLYPEIAACRVRLQTRLGEVVRAYVPVAQSDLEQSIEGHFQEWRRLKSRMEQAQNLKERSRLKEQAHEASARGWALKKAFLNVRHAYALTCHKSQGSTFDCALVDFSDLAKMPDAFAFNRALYVAVTRSRAFLALVVT